MNALSRVLAILVPTASIAFLGFVGVMLAAGPNWGAEREALADDQYSFDVTEGEVVQWTAKFDQKSVGGATTIEPKAILNARQDLKRKQDERIRQLEDANPVLRDRIESEQELIQETLAAMTRRRESLQADVVALRAELKTTADEITNKAQEGLDTQNEVRARRHDIQRLGQQVEELDADTERIRDERTLLEARLTILEGNNQRLERRKSQLEAQLGTTLDDAPVEPAPVDPPDAADAADTVSES